MRKNISYLSAIIITFIFAYIFQTKEIYILLYMLIIAPVLDLLIYLYYKKNILVNINVTNDNLEKREELIYKIEFLNKGILPVLFLDYEYSFNGKFESNNYTKEKISLAPKGTTVREITLRAIHRGLGEIQLDSVKIKSIMGLFESDIDFNNYTNKVSIMPALVDVEGAEVLIESFIKIDDDDGASNNVFQGEPSYDFKEYVPGEPLNRVNWKLSSKTGKLMIRKSATEIKRKKVIVLDPVITGGIKFEEYGDLLIEGLIGLANELYKFDYDVDIAFLESNKFKNLPLNNMDSILMLQKNFSLYNFKKSNELNNRFNMFNSELEKNYDFIIFTTNKDMELLAFISMLKERGNSVSIISNNKNKILDEQFYLNKNYSLERI